MEPESNASATDRDLSSDHRDGGLLAHVEARLRSVVTRPSIQDELVACDFSLAGTLLGALAAVLIGALGGPIIGFWMVT